MSLNDYLLDSSFFVIMWVFFEIIFIFLFITVFLKIFSKIRRNTITNNFKKNIILNYDNENKKYIKTYNDVSKSELSEFNVDNIDDLKNFFYDIFVNFEKAYNSLDYNKMRLLSSKQLFNNYYTGITLNLKAGKKRIIEDIERNNVVIFEIFSSMLKQTATAMIEISYINYIQDKNGKITSGDPTKHITEKFEVEFRKEFERKEVLECPNCGAEVVGNRCEYCRNYIRNEEFKINSIKRIVD